MKCEYVLNSNFYECSEFAIEEFFATKCPLHKIHRVTYSHGNINYTQWFIEDVYLGSFHFYYSNYKTFTESIFAYIKDYPKYINEIETLVRYNNWLTEEQILLLRALCMFR
jgi:hypothetical protein